MTNSLADYLGTPASALLAESPFKHWPFEKSIEDGLDQPVIQYVFPQHGLELRCDGDDKVNTIFLYSDEYFGFDESVLPFTSSRRQVMQRLGSPSKSGGKISDPILGEFGAWDRFTKSEHTIHVEYQLNTDRIRKFTLIRANVVP